MVTTVVSPEHLQVPAGAVLRIPATWAEYQALMRQRGDGCGWNTSFAIRNLRRRLIEGEV